jgi:hypothetical protein
MSSDFTDHPSPHNSPPDEGYTPTRLPRRRDEHEPDDGDAPRLGSLAQKARGKQLKQARGILIAIGALTLIANGIFVVLARTSVEQEYQKQLGAAGGMARAGVNQAQLQSAIDADVFLTRVIGGVFAFMGLVFIVFGVVIHRIPVVATVTCLVLYILGALITALLNPASLAVGLIIKIIIVVGLVKAVQSAVVYERERREEADLGTT